ncbi:MAG TPA: RNA polymerase sigma factor [Bacteroidota bacterium]
MDESVFREFYERTYRSLWLYCSGMVNNDALADDIFQESYIRFLQSDVEFDNEAKMKSYLYRTATNCMRDHWRKMKRERLWFAAEGTEEADSRDPVATRHDLEKTFAGLSPQQRSLLWLAYAESYEHREIAQILDLKEKSVKVLLFRAKQKMVVLAGKLGMTQETTR